MSELFDSVEATWYGHASVKLEDSDGFTVYVDPWSEVMGDMSEEDKADVIISTHSHFDHFNKKAIQALKKRGTVVICTEDSEDEVPEDLEAKVLRPGTTVKAKDHRFRGVEAYNMEEYREADEIFHPQGLCTGVIFDLDGVTFYHASDTDPVPEMEDLAEENVDVAFMPVGGHYTMNQDEAVTAVKLSRPGKVVPIHYGYIDETTADTNRFKDDVESQTDAKVVVMSSER
ncbi:MBL fold metallo-hydrolase [Candidatus Nanosalina sp. VS9-1]|uniref:MBL fold metallo-hydrolase n=1 Tax=Candidatus Nanosalina sp. VS9-1 TaxID=3388566 RepID=UPI0039E10885